MHQVLVVGTGSIGERHARCFSQVGRALVGIVEPNESLRQAVRDRLGLRHAYASLDDALASHAWRTAIICTPAHTHVALAQNCLAQGLPVLIEKPLAVATSQAQGLLQQAGDALVGVAYVYRAHPGLAAMHAAISAGRFGRPLQVAHVSGQHFPTYRPAYASTYYTRHETGGGTIQDALTHNFNAVQWIVGPATSLCADVDHYVLKDTQVEDSAHVISRHGQVMASFSCNQHQAPNEGTLTVICERGTARFEVHNQRWMWQTDPAGQWQIEPAPLASRDTWFEMQAAAWLDAIEGKRAPLCTLTEAYNTLAMNEASLQSARERRWVDIKPL